ncbi:MAG: filamentous hemagglutinin N-terminal domain-containing protein [Candidatus Eremiobacteraeota bacterium]|nr:filamentous hemagglutinin N-terminal domain-containing protein [Candidatus Eremiobacteraeota bacterium]
MSGRIHRTLLAALLASGVALALPENGQVIQGSLQISQPQSHILQILQSSPTGIINWGSFNIDAHQLVQFLQPGASSALLNRVIGQDPSQILGQIQANGRILLVNPNGILFGPGSSVNAGSFLATTLSIQDQDFIQGRYQLQQDPNSPLRAVVNQGEIRVTDGGFIALISPLVDNQGLLIAQQGQVVLGATRQATLQVDARGLLQVSIPDGFRGHSQPSPQTVLLTQGQMSDTLAQLVRGGQPEGERIIETAQGIQLVGAEGLLVNQGTIRSQAGNILMDSSQATVNTPGSLVSASSAQGNGGEIRVLSAGSAIQMGQLAVASQSGDGGFIEVSGRTVHLTQAPDLSAPQGKAGQLLIDPDFVHIVSGGGDNPTFPVLAGDAPTTQFINASALDTAGSVIVEAQQDLFIDPGVAVQLTQATDLTLHAVDGNLEMGTGSSISATNPATTITLLAGGTATVRDILASNITINAGDKVDLLSGQFGTAGAPTVMSVNAPHIFTEIDGQIEVVGTSANVSLNAAEDAVFSAGSRFNIQSPTAYLTVEGDTRGVTLLQDASVHASGTGNITFQSNGAGPDTGVFLRENSELRMDGAANVTLDTVGAIFSIGTIRAENAASEAKVNAGTGAQISSVRVPTMTFTSPSFVKFLSGSLGVSATDTVLNANSPSISFEVNSDVHILGDNAQVELTSTGDFGFFSGSTVTLESNTANFILTTPGGGSFDADSTLRAPGAANLTVNSSGGLLNIGDRSTIAVTGAGEINLNQSGGDLSIGQNSLLSLGSGNISLNNADQNIVGDLGSQIRLDGVGNISVNADHGNVDFRDGTTLTASEVNVSAGKDVFLANVAASQLNASGNSTSGAVNFRGGTLGVAGRDTTVNVTGNDISLGGSPLVLEGNRVLLNLDGNGSIVGGPSNGIQSRASLRTDANITMDGDFRMFDGARIQSSGLGNVTIQANSFGMDAGSLISLADPASRLTVNTVADLTTADVAVPNIDLHAGGNQFFNPGTLGRAGVATVLNAASDHDLFFFAGNPIRFAGSTLDYNQTAGGNIFFANAADIRLDGSTSNNVSLDANGFMRTGGTTEVNLSGAAPTRLELTADSFGLDNSRINLPHSASNVSVQSTGVARLDRVATGTFSVTTTAGNVRVLGTIEANDLTINTPRELIKESTSPDPALIAHNRLDITAERISGPVNFSAAGLVQAFPIATDGTTLVRINVTGTNSSDQGDRAANIFYYFPQSGNVQVTNPNGDVLVYNQPNPNPPPPPAAPSPPPSNGRAIATREDLSSAQFVEVTNQAAQSQIQLSNLYSADYLPSTSSVLMLGYNNIGLTHFAPVPLSTPLLELAVVDPAEASQERARSQSAESPAGTSPRTDGATLPGRGETPTVETGVLSPESSATGTRNREEAVRDDQANSMVLAGNDEDEELHYWRKLIEGFLIWEE